MEDLEELRGTTPTALKRLREEPEMPQEDSWMLHAINYLTMESGFNAGVSTTSQVLDYCKIFPVSDVERFARIVRSVQLAIKSAHTVEGD